MARPRRKPVAERKRLNLSFNTGIQSEAAAFEILKKLSQSRKATEFVTSLIIAYLANETKGKENTEVSAATFVTMPTPPSETIEQNTLAVPSKKELPIAESPVIIGHENRQQLKLQTTDITASDETGENDPAGDAEVSQEGIAAAMAIFGF